MTSRRWKRAERSGDLHARNTRDYRPKFCRTAGCTQPFHHEFGTVDAEGVEQAPTPHDGTQGVPICHTSKCRQPEGHEGVHDSVTSRGARRPKLGAYGPNA